MFKEKIINATTGEETWRDYTDEELAQVELAQAQAAKELEEKLTKEAAKKAIFEKLGLTEEEAKLLLG